MSWICAGCRLNNVNSNVQCPICRSPRPDEKLRFDSFEELVWKAVFFRLGISLNERYETLTKQLTLRERNGEIQMMTPEEQLFADFFRNEAERVINLSDVDLRVRREDLIAVIREGKARLTAVREQEREREAKHRKASGFARSVDSDEIASDAVNKIKARAKSLSKMDKVIEGLMKIPGMDRKTAEGIASARNLKDHQEVKANQGINVETLKETKTPISSNAQAFNPFVAKAEEKTETKTEVTIVEEAETIIIKETETIKSDTQASKPFNPFAKE